MKYKFENIIGTKTVIHCNTEEKAKIVFDFLRSKNFTWFHKGSYIDYECYRHKTCFSLAAKTLEFGRKSFFESKGYKIITFEEFMKDNQEFTRGEVVEVRESEESDWTKRIFLAEIEGSAKPFLCVSGGWEEEFQKGEYFYYISWQEIRKYNEVEVNITFKVNGEERPLSELSDETLLKVKNG